jgi:hypothetical protein
MCDPPERRAGLGRRQAAWAQDIGATRSVRKLDRQKSRVIATGCKAPSAPHESLIPKRRDRRPLAGGKSGAVGVVGRDFGKRRPKGPTPRHNALRPMPVTMPRRAASQPVRSGARPGMPSTAPQPRPRHLRPRQPARFLDALRHRGALHARSPQLPGRSSPRSARGGLGHATVESGAQSKRSSFCTLRRPIAFRKLVDGLRCPSPKSIVKTTSIEFSYITTSACSPSATAQPGT